MWQPAGGWIRRLDHIHEIQVKNNIPMHSYSCMYRQDIQLLITYQYKKLHFPIYRVSQKLMAIILSNLNRFKNFFHWKIPK